MVFISLLYIFNVSGNLYHRSNPNIFRKKYENVNACPDEYLLWFHHVRWDHKMKSGRTLWDELCYKYNAGVDSVRWMQKKWNEQKNLVDKDRFEQVKMFVVEKG